MTIDEIINLIKKKQGKSFTLLQEEVLRCAWDGSTYADIARTLHYQEAYIKNIASTLWQDLSKVTGETITKGNFRFKFQSELLPDLLPEIQDRQVINDHKHDQNAELPSKLCSESQKYPSLIDLKAETFSSQVMDRVFPLAGNSVSVNFDFPGSPIPLHSSCYIQRPPLENTAYQAIQQPGSVLCIQGPAKMGKSSLLIRMLEQATQENYAIATIDLNTVDSRVFDDLDKFLRWLCVNVSWQLGLSHDLDEYWDEIMGSKVNCTLYFQERIFAIINKPLVLAFNEFHRLFEHPEITQDVMALLRFWHEQSKQEPIWENLRLIIVHSLRKFISIDPNHSPFNVGLSLEMPHFSVAQVQELAHRYGLDWEDTTGAEKAEQLVQLLGGHPYLVSLAFHYLINKQLSWISLLNLTPSAIAVYRTFLDNQLRMLEQQPELLQALRDVLADNHRLGRTSLVLGQLQNLGLIRMQGQQAYLLCELYHRYFSDRLLLSDKDELNE